MNSFVAFDTETTGVEPGSRLVEVAAVAFAADGTVTGRFERFVNPGMPMPPDATAINGVTDAMLAGKSGAGAVLDELFSWLQEGAVLVAHNAPFDCGVIAWECCRAGLAMPRREVVDTLPMARKLGGTPDNKLGSLVARYGVCVEGAAHRALPDADALRQVFLRMSEEVEAVPGSWPSRYGYSDEFPDTLRGLPSWVEEARHFTFSYTDKSGSASARKLTPYGWATGPNGMLVHGLCHAKKARRMFRADSMKDVVEAET